MGSRLKTRIKQALKLGFTAAILFSIFYVLEPHKIFEAVAAVSIPWLLAMYGAVFCRKWVDAFQMKYILGRAGMRVPVVRVFLANALSAFYGLVLAGDIVASGAKWFNLSAATGKKSAVLNAIVYNRMIPFMLPLLIGAAALAIENPFPETYLVELAVTLVLCGFGAFLCLYHPKLGAWTERHLRGLTWLLPTFIAKRANYVLDSVKLIRSFRIHEHGSVVALATLAVFCGFVRFAFGMKAMSIEVPLLSIVWIFAFLGVSRLLPLTIGGLGIREGFLVLALTPLGVSAETAVAFGLVLFTNHILIAFVGAGYQIALLNGWARWNTAPVSQSRLGGELPRS